MPAITVAASAPGGNACVTSQRAKETESTVWIMRPSLERGPRGRFAPLGGLSEAGGGAFAMVSRRQARRRRSGSERRLDQRVAGPPIRGGKGSVGALRGNPPATRPGRSPRGGGEARQE